MSRVFHEALKYWTRGWNVIPISPNSKTPAIPWRKYQEQRATKEELIEWFVKNPRNNVGIVTGKISNLVVIDLDGAEGLQSAGTLQLTSTIQALTPNNGKHLFYSWTGETKNAVRKVPGVDIRGDGGYVVAAPSVLESGKSYKWLRYGSALPAYDARILGEPRNLVSTAVAVGGRNDALARIAGGMRKDGMEYEEIFAKLKDENLNRCKPPLDESEVQTIAKSICRYDKGTVDMDSIGLLELFRDHKDVKWVVEGLIPEESISIIGGLPGVGKSFATLDLAIEACRGGKWLGVYPVQKCNTLYIDEESSGSLLKERLTKMLNAKGMKPEDAPIRISLNKNIRFTNLMKLKTVRKMIEQYLPKLIICDSLIKVNDGDENFSTAMNQFFEAVSMLAHEYKIAFLFLDHEGKNVYQSELEGRDPSSGDLRGSNSKSAACDSVFSLRNTKSGLRFFQTKARYGQQALPITIKIEDDGPNQITVKGY